MFRQIIGATVIAAATITGAAALETIDLGGSAKGDPSVVWYDFQGADYVGAFVRGSDGYLYANVGNPVTTDWTGWAKIGDELLKGSPSCVATTTQLIDCVAVGANNAVMHVRYNSKLHQWSKWESLGGYATSDPSAVRTKVDGGTVLSVFVRGPNNLLFRNDFADGGWSDWTNLEVAVGKDLGCTDVFVWGAHCYDTSGGSAKQYTDVTRQSGAGIFIDDIGGAISDRASGVASGSKGDTLRVFVHGPNDHLWVKKWANGGWGNWKEINADLGSAPACAMRKGGKLVVCLGIAADNTTQAIVLNSGEF